MYNLMIKMLKVCMKMKDNLSAYSSNDYDNRVNSVLPYYQEFHFQILDLVKVLNKDKIRWLDTGCGTGNLTQKALEYFDNIEFTLCDPSENMLKTAENKLGHKNIQYFNIDSQHLDFDNEFDIVTAVQSHHYLDMESRKTAAKHCYQALKQSGIYITFENIALSTPQSDVIGIERWKRFLASNGKTTEEIKSHVSRRGTEVFPITVEQHIKLLRECGFRSVDILWASYMQAGLFAIK